MTKIKLFIITFVFVLPLFGQYSFDFVCVSDTFQTGTDYFIYYFRLTNTGTLPDSYAFDCRVIDSVPGWFEIYCAGGQCAEPGIILYDYLTPGAVDTGIDISVYTAQNVWGREKINLLVRSLRNPGLRDSINVYAAMEQSVFEAKKIIPYQNQPKLETYPNPFKKYLQIKYQIGNANQNFLQEPEFNLAIYELSGRMIKKFNHLTNRQFNEIIWYGEDDSGNILPDGVYIICVETNRLKATKVVVKLK